MVDISVKGKTFHTLHNSPQIGELAPTFVVANTDLCNISLDDFKGQPVLINVYPSIDTSVCFSSVKQFAEVKKDGVVVLCISMDLPFALRRAADGEKLKNIWLLSDFRNREFGDLYGLTIVDGPLAGLLARSVILLDKNHRIKYIELVENLENAPNYKALIKMNATER